MLEISITVLLASYVAYRLAIMVVHFLSYGNVLDGVKVFFALKVNRFQFLRAYHASIGESLSNQVAFFENDGGVFDHLQSQSKWFTLLNCAYCISIWISIPITIIALFKVGLFALLIPIIAFHLIDFG